ncbi:MAG TPA: hypothetical protein VFZ45_04670 [Actinomycetota bacterium]|nr:hypothetical protein [Actinomycetota bacterium]
MVEHALLLGAVLLLGACTSEEPAAQRPVSPEPSPPASSPTPRQPGAPSPVVPEHGEKYWAVYLAVGDGPELEDAIAYLTGEQGIEFPGPTDVNCDQGAAEALGPDAGPLSVAAYFDSEEDARAWAETLPGPPVAIAEVRTFCLD